MMNVQILSDEYFEIKTYFDPSTKEERSELDCVATFVRREDAVKFAEQNDCQFVLSVTAYPDNEYVVYRVPQDESTIM